MGLKLIMKTRANHVDDLDENGLKWQLAFAKNPRSQKNRNKSQDSSSRTVNVEESSSKAMLAIDGTDLDWRLAWQMRRLLPTLHLWLSLTLRIELNKSESDLDSYKKGLASVEEQLVFYKKNESMLCDQIVVLKRDASFNELDINGLKKQPEFEGYGVKVNKGASENVSKEVKKTLDAPIVEDWISKCDEDETVMLESLNVQKPKQDDQPRKVSQNPRKNSTSWNTPMPKKLGDGTKPVLNNVKKGTGQREVRPVWTNAMRVNHQKFSNSRRNFAPTAVLTKSGLVPFSTARQSFSRTTAPVSAARSFNTVVPLIMLSPRQTASQSNLSHLKRSFYQQTTLKIRNLNNKVNTAKEYILLGMTKAKDFEVCKITRADGSLSFHGDIQAVLRRLDRQDLSQLYSLVQERFKDHPLEGHDLDLWGDLRMIFDPNEEDDIWLNQQYWELLRWKLHEYSDVHSLFLDGTSIQINMLVEKKYPLKKEIMEKMINLKIEAVEESNVAHELIKFIKS
ncbi:hypothetical protein Tco_1555081 [Tanacetum coccineum]